MANEGSEMPADVGSNWIARIVIPQNLALLRRGDRFVIMAAGLIVVAALGGVAALRDEPVVATVLVIASILIVAGLVGLVQGVPFRWETRKPISLKQLSREELSTVIGGKSSTRKAILGCLM